MDGKRKCFYLPNPPLKRHTLVPRGITLEGETPEVPLRGVPDLPLDPACPGVGEPLPLTFYLGQFCWN